MVPLGSRVALEIRDDDARQDQQPLLVEDVGRGCLSDGRRGRRDQPVLARKIAQVFHGVELSVAKQRGVIVMDQRRLDEGGVAAARPDPRVELRQPHPAGGPLVVVRAPLAAAVDVFAQLVALPHLAEERVREASAERGAEANPLRPPGPREQRIEPDLILEDHRQATQIEPAMRQVLDPLLYDLIVPFDIRSAVGERLRAQVIDEERHVLRNEKRRLFGCHAQLVRRCGAGAPIEGAVGGERQLGERLHHREVRVVRNWLVSALAKPLAPGNPVGALQIGVRVREEVIGVRV